LNQGFFYFKAKKIYHKLPGDIKSAILLTLNNKSYENINNDYNFDFLPKTQFINFDYTIKDMSFDDGFFDYRPLYSYYIDIFENNLIVTTRVGSFYKIKIEDIFFKAKKIKKQKLKTNIKLTDILDSLIVNDQLYISVARNVDNCEKLFIYYSTINDTNENLNFEVLKKFEECADTIGAGRMQPLNFKSEKGLLISTGRRGEGGDRDDMGNFAQDDKSIFGKILFVNLNTSDYFIFSKGFRNTQGLFVYENKILSTDHGPKGGDELNEILFDQNYGWPISSYGETYARKDIKYKDSHLQYGFKEPIFSFVPSIGISELYLVPDDFSEKWKNSILITSLNGKAIYRLQFQTKNYEKIVYSEPIYIGQRIRDIKYIKQNKTFLLALETLGELGILSKK